MAKEKINDIKEVSLSRLRERYPVPSIDDDLLVFQDIKMIPQIKTPRRMNCLLIGVCTKGSGSYYINQKQVSVHAGEALILTEGLVVDNVEMSPDCEGIACIISYPFLYEIVKDIPNISTLFLLARRHPVFALQPEDIQEVHEYFGMIHRRLVGGEYRFRQDVVRLLLVTMIYELGDTFYKVLGSEKDENFSTRSEQIFVHYLQLVEHHFISQRRVGWYAEQMGITAKYLSETVSNISHHSPNEWIERYVTSEIRNQLRKTNKKISDIAKEMNFPNQSFLGKYFKENTGMSPSEYRKQGNEE